MVATLVEVIDSHAHDSIFLSLYHFVSFCVQHKLLQKKTHTHTTYRYKDQQPLGIGQNQTVIVYGKGFGSSDASDYDLKFSCSNEGSTDPTQISFIRVNSSRALAIELILPSDCTDRLD